MIIDQMSSLVSFLSTLIRWPVWVAAFLWFAAAGSGAFWALQLPQTRTAVDTPVVTAGRAGAHVDLSAGLTRIWGLQTDAPAVYATQSVRYDLLGVVAEASGRGSALIAMDGKPPKAYRVGDQLSETTRLQSLGPREAVLSGPTATAGPVILTLPTQELAK
jgi:general secretion pathway protein C